MTCFEALEMRSDMIFVHVATIIIDQKEKEDANNNSQQVFDYDNYGEKDKSKHKNDDDAIGI